MRSIRRTALLGAVAAAAVLVPTTPVLAATPTLTTGAANGTVGQPIYDLATVTGGVRPSGTITFRLYSDPACSIQVFSPPNAALDAGHGNPSAASASFTPTAPGDYRWRASYSGDANNNPVPLSPCNEPGETSVVAQATPSLITIATNAAIGQPIRDSATLIGAFNPVGMVTFRLYSDPDCSTEIFTSTNPVNAGDATSADFTPTAVGSYRWRASYSGDANNAAVPLAACNVPRETSAVSEPGVPQPPESPPQLPGLVPQPPGAPGTQPAPALGTAMPVRAPEEGLTRCAARVTASRDGTVKLCDASNPPTASTSQTLTGSLPAKLDATAAKRKKKSKPAVLGRGQTTIPAGQSRPVVAKLGARVRRALARRGRLAVVAIIEVRGVDGKTATVNRTVALQAAKKKRKRR